MVAVTRATRVLAALLAIALGPGPAPAAAPGGRPSPTDTRVVVDAAGRLVGSIALGASSESALVRIRLGEIDGVVSVTADRFDGALSRILFEDAGCAGPPWVQAGTAPGVRPFFPESGIGPPNVLYVGQGSRETRMIQAEWRVFDPPSRCEPQAATPTDVRPVVPLLDLDTFTPPFRVR